MTPTFYVGQCAHNGHYVGASKLLLRAGFLVPYGLTMRIQDRSQGVNRLIATDKGDQVVGTLALFPSKDDPKVPRVEQCAIRYDWESVDGLGYALRQCAQAWGVPVNLVYSFRCG